MREDCIEDLLDIDLSKMKTKDKKALIKKNYSDLGNYRKRILKNSRNI
jgi:hypothetical protein